MTEENENFETVHKDWEQVIMEFKVDPKNADQRNENAVLPDSDEACTQQMVASIRTMLIQKHILILSRKLDSVTENSPKKSRNWTSVPSRALE